MSVLFMKKNPRTEIQLPLFLCLASGGIERMGARQANPYTAAVGFADHATTSCQGICTVHKWVRSPGVSRYGVLLKASQKL